jgi:hypothetical protein
MNRFVLALVALCTLALPVSASADAIPTTPPTTVAASGTYNFDFLASGPEVVNGTTVANPVSYAGSGTLTVGSGGLITDITGTVNGFFIDALNTGSTAYGSPDNILYDGSVGALLDFSGFSFHANSGVNYSIGNTGNGSYGITDSVNNSAGYCCGVSPATFNVTAAVPEPATWAMMLVGFGAIGFNMRRKRTAHIPQLA